MFLRPYDASRLQELATTASGGEVPYPVHEVTEALEELDRSISLQTLTMSNEERGNRRADTASTGKTGVTLEPYSGEYTNSVSEMTFNECESETVADCGNDAMRENEYQYSKGSMTSEWVKYSDVRHVQVPPPSAQFPSAPLPDEKQSVGFLVENRVNNIQDISVDKQWNKTNVP